MVDGGLYDLLATHGSVLIERQQQAIDLSGDGHGTAADDCRVESPVIGFHLAVLVQYLVGITADVQQGLHQLIRVSLKELRFLKFR